VNLGQQAEGAVVVGLGSHASGTHGELVVAGGHGDALVAAGDVVGMAGEPVPRAPDVPEG
jgi:hypothetical protein